MYFCMVYMINSAVIRCVINSNKFSYVPVLQRRKFTNKWKGFEQQVPFQTV